MVRSFWLLAASLILFSCGESGQLVDTAASLVNTDTTNLLSVDTAAFTLEDEGFRQSFDIQAYIDDPDTESPTNIHNLPDGDIILKLPQDDSYMVTIISQHSGWFEISDIVSFMSELEIPEGSMWIHPSVLAANTRNYNRDEKIQVYRYPEENEAYAVGLIESETKVRLREFYLDFVHIQCTAADGAPIDGWIHKDWLCGNPVTTCP